MPILPRIILTDSHDITKRDAAMSNRVLYASFSAGPSSQHEQREDVYGRVSAIDLMHIHGGDAAGRNCFLTRT